LFPPNKKTQKLTPTQANHFWQAFSFGFWEILFDNKKMLVFGLGFVIILDIIF